MGYDFGNPYSLLLLTNTVLIVVFVIVLGRYRKNRAAQGVIGVLLGAGLWSLADALRFAATTGSAILFWNKVSYVGAVVIPPAFLYFVVVQTDHEEWIRPTYAGAVIAASLGALATVVTNPWHGLWRVDETVRPGTAPPVLIEELGVVHMLWSLYVLLLVVPVGLALLLDQLRNEQTSALVRRQTTVVLFGVAGPILTSVLFTLRVLRFDLTPFGFGLMGMAMAIAITRYRLFDIVPIARDSVVENIDAGVLVVDS